MTFCRSVLSAALLSVALVQCKRSVAPVVRDATAGGGLPTAAQRPLPAAAPETLLVQIRGASLRRAVPMLVPGGGAAEVIEQLAPRLTPGIGDHNDEVDVDSPFAAAGLVSGDDQGTLVFAIAWPLRPGMAVAQDARALRGWRLVSDGVYAPTAVDAGGASLCWLAQRAPVGWMLLCGPTDLLPSVAGFLRDQAQRAPDGDGMLDISVTAPALRRLLQRQLADLERQAPQAGTSPEAAFQHATWEDVHATARMVTSLAGDLDQIHLALTQDANTTHLRAEASFARRSGDATRALFAAANGRVAPRAFIEMLPASVTAWSFSGFDRTHVLEAFGQPHPDPSMIAQVGQELALVLGRLDEAKNVFPPGERVDGFALEGSDVTMYRVIRRADAVQFVNDLRVAINSVPARAVPGGGSLRDLATVLPTPGLTGTNILRVGRNVHIPPGMQVAEEVRADVERSMLLVAEGDRLVVITSRDPIARYRAMSQGPRLAASSAATAVMSGRVTPPAFVPMAFGAPIPGLPPTSTAEGIDFAVTVEPRGEGARVEVRADAPIAVATEVRMRFAMVQQVQAAMIQQLAQQQRAMQQGGAAGAARSRPRPAIDPGMLPEPPDLRLQPPR